MSQRKYFDLTTSLEVCRVIATDIKLSISIGSMVLAIIYNSQNDTSQTEMSNVLLKFSMHATAPDYSVSDTNHVYFLCTIAISNYNTVS